MDFGLSNLDMRLSSFCKNTNPEISLKYNYVYNNRLHIDIMSFVQSGGDYLPKSNPGRAYVWFWWVFSIILIVTYGGNLIAYLTVSKSEVPFRTVEDIINQDRYKWGTRYGTVYFNAFQVLSKLL